MFFVGSKLIGIYVLQPIWANAQGENSQSEHPNTPPGCAPRCVCLGYTKVRPPQGTIGTRSGRSKNLVGAEGPGLPLLARAWILVAKMYQMSCRSHQSCESPRTFTSGPGKNHSAHPDRNFWSPNFQLPSIIFQSGPFFGMSLF